ncbi:MULTISPECIES: sensor histidine kinase [Paraburkholderia]|uniref:sensor histidine kinase n=1 Tax=Paraburkholderia TaxID=1822464 RepID=UPI0022550547|nr:MULTISPECIES: HAMP domain-containing sensor histidine kinase [Paraburkholderia]MCX4174765.1 HAMP domain-containing sensor histidine kinase [Paraburkholderia madseniana]MDQ6462766.1 HAMP domain-containing histidine kinase [Paraburkholderia madseniana]
MQPRRSLRLKVALVFSALTILLLVAQALGVKTLAEAQEETLISALIEDDMASLLQSYRTDPKLIPPIDPRLGAHVSIAGTAPVALPTSAKDLREGTHEIIVDDQEIHVTVAAFGDGKVFRVYNFSRYEQRFKKVIDALMAGTGVFALLTIWLAFGLSGLLVRQVAGFARQVNALRLGGSASINPGKYDEAEVVELVEAFNDYHRRITDMIEREKEFTSNVSHELRTPLTAIKTSSELLEQDALIGPKSRARLRQIDRAADNMIELVNALLLLAREESAVDISPVRLAHLVETALAPFSERLTSKGVAVTIEVDRDLQVEANRSALAIVLSNLIDNATRYTDHGQIRFSHVDGWLRIEDTGPGIPAEALPHVFERFYRAGEVAAQSRGFGIGLSIVKKLCDRHQWPIQLDSKPGDGTCVSLRLPVASRNCTDFTPD